MLEVEQQDGEFVVVRRGALEFGDVEIVDDHGAGISECLDRRLHDGVGLLADAKALIACDADAGALQRIGVQELRVVQPRLAGVRGRGWISRVDDARDGGQHRRRVGDSSPVRSDRVLIVRDWHNAGPTRQANGGLDPDYCAVTGGADDGAICFCRQRGSGEAGRRGSPGA